ncbi:MAG: aminotransferase class V-fold PLP-dependent enzyme, partial [Nitrospinales bacterium]
GAQSAPHMKIDVRDLDCDFYAFSSHKMYGPSGVGGLYAKMELLEAMPPYVTGGDMILQVTLEKTAYAKPPAKFEAGTPPISQVIGLGAAIDYLNGIGLDPIREYEKKLLDYGTQRLKDIPGLRIIGNARHKAGVISFYLDDIHPHDIVTLLDQDGVELRGGHHCAQPTMKRFGVPATARASVAFYNKFEELDILAASLRKAIKLFSG